MSEIGSRRSAVSLKAQAYDAVKAAILRMDIYAPDAKLKLDERDLSARYGVSRTPMREALALLDKERLVKVCPRRGTFIVRKTKAEILDMISAWAALESMAARLAADVARETDFDELNALVDPYAQGDPQADLGDYSDANIRFHQAIIKASGNPFISDLTDGLFFHVRAIRHRTIRDQDRAQRSVEDHAQIVAALKQRNGERAGQLVREHTLKLGEHVAENLNLN